MYPGMWRHGDWIEITSRETAMIYGRSDSTINRGGVRMGTSEIYRAVLAVDDVVDALVVDVPRAGAEAWMPLFVVLREGASLDDSLMSEIRRRVREDCSPRHVPDEIRADRRGPADAVREGAGSPGEADPDGNATGSGRLPRVSRKPGRARLFRRGWGEKFRAPRTNKPEGGQTAPQMGEQFKQRPWLSDSGYITRASCCARLSAGHARMRRPVLIPDNDGV